MMRSMLVQHLLLKTASKEHTHAHLQTHLPEPTPTLCVMHVRRCTNSFTNLWWIINFMVLILKFIVDEYSNREHSIINIVMFTGQISQMILSYDFKSKILASAQSDERKHPQTRVHNINTGTNKLSHLVIYELTYSSRHRHFTHLTLLHERKISYVCMWCGWYDAIRCVFSMLFTAFNNVVVQPGA